MWIWRCRQGKLDSWISEESQWKQKLNSAYCLRTRTHQEIFRLDHHLLKAQPRFLFKLGRIICFHVTSLKPQLGIFLAGNPSCFLGPFSRILSKSSTYLSDSYSLLSHWIWSIALNVPSASVLLIGIGITLLMTCLKSGEMSIEAWGKWCSQKSTALIYTIHGFRWVRNLPL